MADVHSQSPAMRPQWPAPVAAALGRLRAAGIEAYAVGGTVRDALLQRPSSDWDLATPSPPQEVARVLPAATVEPRLGAVHVDLPEGQALTVTTFRREADYRDRRHPATVEFVTDLAVDARRRDFTMNAIYAGLDGTLLDPVGGLADLRARTLRAIGPPAERFAEDVLRLLRGVRFAAAYELTVEPATWQAMQSCAPLLEHLSAERAFQELTAAFTGPGRGRALRLLVESRLAAVVLPEVPGMAGVPQPPDYHPEGDVLTHVSLVLDACAPRDPMLAWAAVLHDVGKPATFARVDGRIRFSGHDVLSAEMADAALRRLRAPRELREAVVEICRDHIKFAGIMQMRPRRRERWMRSSLFPAHLAFHRADCLGCHGKLDVWAAAEAAWRALPPAPPPPLCTGEDVLALGVAPGPRVGRLLRAVEAEIERAADPDRPLALTILRRLVDEGFGR
jgi:poly(A) polymerase